MPWGDFPQPVLIEITSVTKASKAFQKHPLPKNKHTNSENYLEKDIPVLLLVKTLFQDEIEPHNSQGDPPAHWLAHIEDVSAGPTQAIPAFHSPA